MSTYYIRKNGNDANDGLTPGAAWLTIGHAEAAVVAGDTVYVGPGWYREQWIAATTGTSGNTITFYADILGIHTGDQPARVIVTSFDINGYAARSYVLAFGGMTFRIWHNFIFYGGSSDHAVGSDSGSAQSLEGIEFYRCTFLSCGIASICDLNLNYYEGVTPATTGALFRYCTFRQVQIRFTAQTTAPIDVKLRFERCVFIGHNYTISPIRNNSATTPNYSIGGITFRNCFFGKTYGNSIYGQPVNALTNDTHPNCIENSVFLPVSDISGGDTYISSAVKTVMLLRSNDSLRGFALGSNYATLQGNTRDNEMIFPNLQAFGICALLEPLGIRFGMFEPLSDITFYLNRAYYGYVIDNPVPDSYGEEHGFTMPVRIMVHGTVTDPDNVWSSEAYAADYLHSTEANTSVVGSVSSNFLKIVGTSNSINALTINSYYSVKIVVMMRVSGNSRTVNIQVATSGEAEILLATSVAVDWTVYAPVEFTPSAPAGGWSASVIDNLEFKIWKTGSATYGIYIGSIYIVAETDSDYPVAGITAPRIHPIVDTSQYNEGASSLKLQGKCVSTKTFTASIATYNISVHARKDATYAGTNPSIELINAQTGELLESDVMSASADTWEELTVSHEFASVTSVAVRLVSKCVNRTGNCWFDDLLIEKA